MKVRLSNRIEFDSIVDGEGLRTVIWMQGCSHNCKGCHNPQTHDFNGGFVEEIDNIKNEILMSSNDGVTLTGGDPMFQIKQSLSIASFCKEHNINVWCYTGFTYEKLVNISKFNDDLRELLLNIDILVDGKFISELRDFSLKYRGSSNQRIIECKKSFAMNKLIYHDLKKENFYSKHEKSDYIFI